MNFVETFYYLLPRYFRPPIGLGVVCLGKCLPYALFGTHGLEPLSRKLGTLDAGNYRWYPVMRPFAMQQQMGTFLGR